LLKRPSAPLLPSHISNTGIHNLSNYPLSEKEILALSLGQTFIPTPRNMNDLPSYMRQQLEDYRRRCSITRYFHKHPPSSETDPKLRVKGSTWNPPLPPGDIIYRYLNQVQAKLDRSIQHAQQSLNSNKNFNKTPDWIHSTLLTLKNNPDIIITDADKNMGICVVSTQEYVAEGMRQLTDPLTYRELSAPPDFNKIRDDLETLLKSHNRFFAPKKRATDVPKLSDLAKFCLQDLGCSHNNPNPTHNIRLRLGHFYMLMKVHKEKVTGRPIVSSFDTCSYHVSRYIDAVLQPILKQAFSYVQSSEHLIHLLEKKPIAISHRNKCVMLCADIESLYPNIPLDKGLEFFKKSIEFNNNKLKKKANHLSPEEIDLICDLTKWVLHNNYFTFGNKIFHQINGTAMGTPCAVVFACLFIDELERSVMKKYGLTTVQYRRYIDDIFAIFAERAHAEAFIKHFNEVCKTIKCSDSSVTISAENGVFLDVIVYRPPSFLDDGKLHTRLFQKKQNKYLYIPPFSNHSKSMFPAFITAEINRYRLLCTNDEDFHTACKQFESRLLDRGYLSSFLKPLFLSLPTRQSLLDKVSVRYSQPPAEKQKDKLGPFVFKVVGTPQTKRLNLAHCLCPSDGLEEHPALEPLFKKKPIVSYSNAPSISTYFSRARKSLHSYL